MTHTTQQRIGLFVLTIGFFMIFFVDWVIAVGVLILAIGAELVWER